MDDVLTTAQLIKHFEDRIENGGGDSTATARGKLPQYPMLVLFLGDDAIQGYPVVFVISCRYGHNMRTTSYSLAFG